MLDLDADVNSYLKSWQVPPVGTWQPRVTLRQLLSHTSGATVHGFMGYLAGTPVPSVVEILDGAAPANSAPVRIDLIPGTQMRYSGGGYTILQLAIAEATGTPFPQLLRDLVLDPLGLSTAGFDQPLDPARVPAAALGYMGAAEPVPGGWHTMPELAAAGLWCRPTDLCLLGAELHDAVQGVSSTLLSQQTMSAAIANENDALKMGLGLVSLPGGWFGHDGGNIGFLTTWLVHRESRCGFAVMTNSLTGTGLLNEIVPALMEQEGMPPFAERPAPDIAALLVSLPGIYRDEAGGELVVEASAEGITVAPPGQPPIAVEPCVELGSASLTELAVPSTQTRFVLDLSTEPCPAIVLRQPGKDVRYTR